MGEDKLYAYAVVVRNAYEQVLVERGTQHLPTLISTEPKTAKQVEQWLLSSMQVWYCGELKQLSYYISEELCLTVFEAPYTPGCIRRMDNIGLCWVWRDYIDPSIKARALASMEGGKLLQ